MHDYMQLNKRDGHIITKVCTQAKSISESGYWKLVSHGVTHTITEVCTQAGFSKSISESGFWKFPISDDLSHEVTHNQTSSAGFTL